LAESGRIYAIAPGERVRLNYVSKRLSAFKANWTVGPQESVLSRYLDDWAASTAASSFAKDAMQVMLLRSDGCITNYSALSIAMMREVVRYLMRRRIVEQSVRLMLVICVGTNHHILISAFPSSAISRQVLSTYICALRTGCEI